MHNHQRLVAAVLLFAWLVLAGSPADWASQPDPASGDLPAATDVSESTSKPAVEPTGEEVLKWLDQYLTKEVLFRKEDLEALRAKVAQMSPAELQKWLEQTQAIRDILDSDQWKSTRGWLEGYLPTKLYTDQEMEQFRKDVGEMSPSDLLELLKRIQQKHSTIQSVYDSQFSAAVSTEQAETTAQMQTQSRMGWLQSYEKNQTAARSAAAQRDETRSVIPLYGQTQARAINRGTEASRRYNQPLITSEGAARIAVDRAIYGGFRRGW